MKKYIILLYIALIVAVDQLSKYYIVQHLAIENRQPLWSGWVYLTCIINRGAAFGILANQYILFIAIAVIMLVVFAVYIYSCRQISQLLLAGLGLMIAGTLGNLCDRIRLHGVVDFIDLRFWPVFNIADIAITVGMILTIISLWRSWECKTTTEKNDG